MANVRACAIDGELENLHELPPNLQPIELRTAVATYSLVVCNRCLETCTVSDLIQHAEQVGPGGTVEGEDRVPYLVRD